tara:strand:+ start:917 stop:1624 length:708 start_codon:yes stop_codon:yes gene_type:complete
MEKESKQKDLFGIDSKQVKANENKIAEKKFERELEKLKKEVESLEEEEKWRVWDFIKKNQNNISIEEIIISTHLKPSKNLFNEKKGFIHFLWKYPDFKLTDNKETELSLKALDLYKSFYEFDLEEGEMGRNGMKITKFLGGIKLEQLKKWIYKISVDDQIHTLEDSDYFDNTYSFWEETHYRHKFWSEDYNSIFTSEGIEIKWSYPWYFTIFDDGLKNFSQESWNDFLKRGYEII